MNPTKLVEHFFRHEYGKLVAVLSCRVGVEHLEDVEDAAQAALMSALEHWTISGQPDNPSAWLFRAAQNHLLDELRTGSRRRRILQQNANDHASPVETEAPLPEEIHDELLRMLFVCCHDCIPLESRLIMAVKTLCGFDVREIAIRLFSTEASIYKRLSRARDRLRDIRPPMDELTEEQYASRLPDVHRVLYLLFTEGYLSSNTEVTIRRELCNEAIRLTTILAEHRIGETPSTAALLALMHLHRARMTARQDSSGGLLLLEEQDREQWDRNEIAVGLDWLAKSAQGETFSRYHAEAGIAAEHCLAPSFAETRWEKVAECYELLNRTANSPIHRLNQAIAVAEWKGASEGLAVLAKMDPPSWLASSYQWSAIHADLYRRCGNKDEARKHFDAACNSAPTSAVKELLRRRFETTD